MARGEQIPLNRNKVGKHRDARARRVAVCNGSYDGFMFDERVVIRRRRGAIVTLAPPNHSECQQVALQSNYNLIVGSFGDQIVKTIIARFILAPSLGRAAFFGALKQFCDLIGTGVNRRFRRNRRLNHQTSAHHLSRIRFLRDLAEIQGLEGLCVAYESALDTWRQIRPSPSSTASALRNSPRVVPISFASSRSGGSRVCSSPNSFCASIARS